MKGVKRLLLLLYIGIEKDNIFQHSVAVTLPEERIQPFESRD